MKSLFCPKFLQKYTTECTAYSVEVLTDNQITTFKILELVVGKMHKSYPVTLVPVGGASEAKTNSKLANTTHVVKLAWHEEIFQTGLN